MKPRIWFLPSEQSNILITGFEPANKITQYVIVVPPFAEEMNKSRKMCSDFSRSLAMDVSSNTAVYLVDLFGCGDSEGEIVDATWERWRINIADVATLLHQEHPEAECVLLGIRLGAALAFECAIRELAYLQPSLYFWQPCLNGNQFINQFLRLKVAASMMAGDKLTIAQIHEQLALNGVVEVSGYSLSESLVKALQTLTIHQVEQLPHWMSVVWFEVGLGQTQKLLPVSDKIVSRWQQHNQVKGDFCVGDAFWQSTEITTAKTLIEQTITHLRETVQ